MDRSLPYEQLSREELLEILRLRIWQRNQALKLAHHLLCQDENMLAKYGFSLYKALKSRPEDGSIEL